MVSRKVLSAYARALGGVPVFASLIAIYVLTEIVRVGSSVWLSVWTSTSGAQGPHEVVEALLGHLQEGAKAVAAGRVGAPHTPLFYLGVYCAICFTQA